MTTTCSPTDSPSEEDAILDDFLERLNQASGEEDVGPVVSEYSTRHPARAAEFRGLADTWIRLRRLRDPDRLGPYRIRGVIAMGGMGKVYEAEEDELNRIVAVKTIKPGRNTDEQLLERFDRERKALARFHHTHVVPIFATGRQEGLLYFSMPRIRGASLRGLIKTASGITSRKASHPTITSFEELVSEASTEEASEQASLIAGHPRGDSDPPLKPALRNLNSQPSFPTLPSDYCEKVVRIMVKVAEAVHHAHLASVIHRDLKPSNILVEHVEGGRECHPWVLDFGLAMFKTEQDAERSPQSVSMDSDEAQSLATRVVGTWVYMAPEQIEPANGRPLDARTDVYALGAILYELLTLNRVVDSGESIASPLTRFDHIRRQILHDRPTPPSRIIPNFPRELEAVCLKALEKSRGSRYDSAHALALDLLRWLDGMPTIAGNAGPITRLVMFAKRRRALSAAMTAGTLLVLGTAAAIAILSSAEAKASKAETERARAVAARERQRAESLEREQSIVALQRLWSTTQRHGWFNAAWTQIRSLRGSGPDPQLQGQAAATLEGIDATSIKTFPGEGQAVSWSPDSERLLIIQTEPVPDRNPRFRTTLWERSVDRVIAERELGNGVLAFRRDGTPLQLSWIEENLPDRARSDELRLYRVDTGEVLRTFRSPIEGRFNIRAISLSRDGSRAGAIATHAKRQEVQLGNAAPSPPLESTTLIVWDAEIGEHVFAQNVANLQDLALSPDGRLLAYWDLDGMVAVRRLPGGEEISRFRLGRFPVTCLAFGRDPVWHEDGSVPPWLLAVGESTGLTTIWDLRTNRPRSLCRGSSSSVHALDFNGDGTLLLSVGRDPVKLWDVASGSCLLDLTVGNTLNAVAMAPGGRNIAVSRTTAWSSQIKAGVEVLRLEHGHGIQTLRGLGGIMELVVVSRDGRLVGGLSHECQIGIWERESGRLLGILPAPIGPFVSNFGLAFSEDSRRFACSGGRQAECWDLESGRRIGRWNLQEGLCENLWFASGDRLNLVRVETEDPEAVPFSSHPSARYPRVVRCHELSGESNRKVVGEIKDFAGGAIIIRSTPNGSITVIDGFDRVDGKAVRRLRAYQSPSMTLLEDLPTQRGLFPSSEMLMDPNGHILLINLGPSTGSQLYTLFALPTLTNLGLIPSQPHALDERATRWASTLGETKDRPNSIDLHARDREGAFVRIVRKTGTGMGLCFSTNGRYLVSANIDGTISVLDLVEINTRLSEVRLGW